MNNFLSRRNNPVSLSMGRGHARACTEHDAAVHHPGLVFKAKVSKNTLVARQENKIFLARIAGEQLTRGAREAVARRYVEESGGLAKS